MTSATHWTREQVKSLDKSSLHLGETHQSLLTKPPGSLGVLESIAIKFCGFQGRKLPELNHCAIRVFAADHGVCAQGVSAFPQVVTTQMIANFCTGGAAISVLSRYLEADFAVVSLGTAHPLLELPADNERLLIDKTIGPGTRDFSLTRAMTETELEKALLAGKEVLEDCLAAGDVDLFIGGEMGIGNTSSASAIYSALLELSPQQTVGPGTGVDKQGLQLKTDVLTRSLELHQADFTDPLQVMQCVGGFEISALTGAYIASAQRGVPVLVDGFICTAAALIACHINPDAQQWFLFSHKSAEPAHVLALESLGETPLLDLDMRLGEGSGAAIAIPILKSALRLHCEMATFADAKVSDSAP